MCFGIEMSDVESSPNPGGVAALDERPDHGSPVPMTGRVKFYDTHKAMGFLYFDDGSPDAFFHKNALSELEMDSVAAEATLRADVVLGIDGRRRILRVTAVDLATVTAAARHSQERTNRRRDASRGPVRTEVLVPKWYNESKGFGFLHSRTCGDVFVHATTLTACGIHELDPDGTYEVDVCAGDRGLMAVSLRRADSDHVA